MVVVVVLVVVKLVVVVSFVVTRATGITSFMLTVLVVKWRRSWLRCRL